MLCDSQPNAEQLTQIAALIDAGSVRPLVGAEFALADVAKAHELSESHRAVGKIVLSVSLP